MADTQAATRCPTCQKAFKIKPEYMGRSLQCKSCKTVFKASLADIPAVEPVENKIKVHNALPSESYVQRLARQQRSSSNSMLVLVLLGLFGAGLGFYFYKESIFQLLHVASNQSARPTLPTVQESLLQPNVMIDKLGGDLTSMPEQNQRDKRNLARIPAPYPGRALLIGIRDYLYLNPLNPGFRVERSFLGDALGLQSLQRNLITELSFPREQVLLLTDVDDQKHVVPTRATIQATVEDFLQNSRTGDRIVLVFAVHAVHLAGNTYLIPIDGEIPPENAKPDVERDARLAEQLIPLSWLYEKLQQCPSKQKLLILDIAQSDPEAGVARLSPGPLTEAMFAEIEKVPEDVQIWLPCRASQSSIGLSNSGQAGTVFMDVLNQHLTFSVERNWKRIEKDPRLKAGILPLVLLAEDIEKEVAAYVSQKGYEQQPILLGKELTPVPSENETAQAVALKVVQPSEALVSGKEIQSVLLELGLASDAMRRLGTSSFPPLLKSHFEAYTADYASLAELENKINEFPLRLL
ncbi:MAG TPA: caspase family protein, partial [Gemmatales bacterium]|nr:caspase family protein [Gemmatales bacterium]